MILETGKFKIKGMSLVEILVAMVIIGLFMVFSVFYPHKAISRTNLDITCKCVCEILNKARSYAVAEHKKIQVIFNHDSCGIYQDGKIIDKIYRFPRLIVIKETTDGLFTCEFLPEGTAKQAGHITLEDTATKATKTIVLYNLTGKAVIKK